MIKRARERFAFMAGYEGRVLSTVAKERVKSCVELLSRRGIIFYVVNA